MNWGKGIAITLALFMGFITYLVIQLVSHNVELETDDYYKKDIAYQDEITSMRNANALKEKPTISMTETHIVVQFPSELAFSKAQLHLKRPNDETDDRSYEIFGTSTFTLNKSELERGVYKLELSYIHKDKNYLQKIEYYI